MQWAQGHVGDHLFLAGPFIREKGKTSLAQDTDIGCHSPDCGLAFWLPGCAFRAPVLGGELPAGREAWEEKQAGSAGLWMLGELAAIPVWSFLILDVVLPLCLQGCAGKLRGWHGLEGVPPAVAASVLIVQAVGLSGGDLSGESEFAAWAGGPTLLQLTAPVVPRHSATAPLGCVTFPTVLLVKCFSPDSQTQTYIPKT